MKTAFASLFVLPILFVFAVSSSAQAAGNATVLTAGLPGGVKIEWLDLEHIRVDVVSQPGYLLLLKNRSYHVANVGGQMVSTNLQLLARLIGPENLPEPPQTAADAKEIISIRTQGYSHSVANIRGEIYDVTWIAQDGQRHNDVALLSKNITSIEFTHVLRHVARVLSRVADKPNRDVLGSVLAQRNLGVLHFGDQLHVESLSGATPPMAIFALP